MRRPFKGSWGWSGEYITRFDFYSLLSPFLEDSCFPSGFSCMFLDKLHYPVVEPKSLLVCKHATKISVQTWKDEEVPEKEEVTLRNRRCFTLIYLLTFNLLLRAERVRPI